MGLLPHHLTFEISGIRTRVVHGSVREINRFIFASQPAADFETEFSLADADMVIGGHSGIPFSRQVGKRVWHNSGSLGLPANDGTSRVWFSVLTPRDGGVRIDHHPLDYDHALASSKMIGAGVCTEYADTLVNGIWPSLDILPPTERRATGRPLDLSQPFFCAARTVPAQ